jgi:hypothetical protein
VVRVCSAVQFVERFGNCEMEWTEGSGIELIELYKRKEIIWDPKHPMNCNKIRQQDAWEELRKEINRTIKCKKKMENLPSSLRREKMKMMKSSGTGKGEHFY